MRPFFFSLAAFALACATSSPNQQTSGTRRAQDDAQHQYQDAASAQKRATEEQDKAEQADRDVTNAQKALADAKLRRDGQHAKAAQAQRDAAQMARDAQERGAEMQRRATQLQAEEASRAMQDKQRVPTQMIHGALTAVTPNTVTVRSDDGGDVRLQVSDSTIVNLDGRSASVSAVRTGADVRASYGILEGQATATRLDITSSQPRDEGQDASFSNTK